MNRRSLAPVCWATALTMGIALSGCVSKEETKTDPVVTPGPSVTGVELHGTAGKGLLIWGAIFAEELDASGDVIDYVGGGESKNFQGRFEFSLEDNYTGGPILLTATLTDNSAVKCDVPDGCGIRSDDAPDFDGDRYVDFGEWWVPAELELKALIPGAEANESIGVNISPFTHLAASRALSMGHLDAETVSVANSEISNLLGGIDIINTKFVDITNPEVVKDATATQIVYSALSSAVAVLGNPNTFSNRAPNLKEALEILNHSLDNGYFPADDSVLNDKKYRELDQQIFSLTEIVEAAELVLDEINVSDTSGILTILKSEIAAATDIHQNDDDFFVVEPEGETDPGGITDIALVPSNHAGDTKLGKSKFLVEELRTWLYLINTDIQESSTAFSEEVELVSASAELVRNDLIEEILLSAIEVARQYDPSAFDPDDDPPQLSDYTVDRYWGWQFTDGEITHNTAGEILIQEGKFERGGKEFASINATIIVPEDEALTAGSSYTIGVKEATIISSYADATVTSGLVTINLAEDYTVDTIAINDGSAILPNAESIDIDLQIDYTQKWDYDSSRLASIIDPNPTWIDRYFEDPIKYTGRLTTNLIPTTDTDTNKISWIVPAHLTLEGRTATLDGDKNVVRELSATFTTNIDNADTVTLIDSQNPETLSNMLEGDASVTFTATMDGFPEAYINIHGERTGLESGVITITITYDEHKLTFWLSGDQDNNTHSDITVTHQDGAVLTLSLNDATEIGRITYNGVTYGTISKTESGYIKIEYIDNTFEIM